jgi:hypothetical protein
MGIDESSPDPPAVLPKPRVQLRALKQESERDSPSLSQVSHHRQDPISHSPPKHPPVTLDATNNDWGDTQKPEIVQHTHHHHYWIRSSSAPAHTTRRPNQLFRRYSNEAPIPATEAELDSFTGQFPRREHTEQAAEHQVPAESSRHRYIIGTPPKSEQAHVKILSDGFSRRKHDWKEEHTHIHIYVPSSPCEVERDAARCNPARSPILEGPRNTGGQSICSKPTQMAKNQPTSDKRKRQSRHLGSIRRTRRHRRSFQD